MPKEGQKQRPSFITEYLEATKETTSPEIFQLWSAIGCVASALGRRVWWRMNHKTPPLFPNMFVMLVGPPGSGKSQAIDPAQAIMNKIPGIKIAPDTITREQFFRRMAQALEARDSLDPNSPVPELDSTYCVVNSEVGNFIPRQDTVFMRMLARMYDCPATFKYVSKHGSGKENTDDHIESPCLNIIGGVQPPWIREALPQEAFDLGFPARLVLVHSALVIQPEVADEEPDDTFTYTEDNPILVRLAGRLRKIAQLRGRFKMTPEARTYLQDFIAGTKSPPPSHSKLASYNTRRWFHLTKLAMIVSAARRTDLLIVEDDIAQAETYLVEAERTMPAALHAAGDNPLRPQMDRVLIVIAERQKRGLTTPEHVIMRELYDDAHPQQWRYVLEGLSNAGLAMELMGEWSLTGGRE